MEDSAVILYCVAGWKSMQCAFPALELNRTSEFQCTEFWWDLGAVRASSLWKASFIIDLSVVRKYDRQDTRLTSVELGWGVVVGVYGHYMWGKMRVLACIAACLLAAILNNWNRSVWVRCRSFGFWTSMCSSQCCVVPLCLASPCQAAWLLRGWESLPGASWPSGRSAVSICRLVCASSPAVWE